MKRRTLAIGLGCLVVVTASLAFASTAHATTPPCNVTGSLSTTPGHVTATFHVAETCKEVSLLSWLAPDAHAGMPQTLFDRHSENDVAPGDYSWSITRPADDCYFQLDLRIPGHNVDAILGGDHKCETPTTTTLSTTTSIAPGTTTTPTTSAPPNPTTIPSSLTTASGSAVSTPAGVIGTPSTNTEQLAFSGGGELWALALGALGLIGFGRWLEFKAKRRRERL